MFLDNELTIEVGAREVTQKQAKPNTFSFNKLTADQHQPRPLQAPSCFFPSRQRERHMRRLPAVCSTPTALANEMNKHTYKPID